MKLQAQVGRGGGQGEERVDSATAGGHFKPPWQNCWKLLIEGELGCESD